MTISVVFPSCDQIQPMDGLFYTKDEVAPCCSPEDRGCFSFPLFSFLKFYLTYMAGPVLCLFKLPSTGVLHTAKKKKVFILNVYLWIVEACSCGQQY